jgi:uncharacterized protein YndB with AHSA1/START domain
MTAHDVVRVTRTLRAAPQDVYDAWTQADRLQEWLCPGPGFVSEATCDPVVGGRYRIVKVLTGGVDEVTGEYLIVEPPHRLVFTWTAGSTDGQPTRVTVTLGATRANGATGAESGGGPWTEMTILHERLPTRRVHTGASAAWADLAEKLDAYLTRTGARPK